MALTWREVAAPNFSGVAASQLVAGRALDGAFDSLSSTISKFGETRKDAASSRLAIDALKFTDPAAYQEALRSGSLLDGRNLADITPETIDFLAGRARSLQGNQAADLANIGTMTGNAQQTFNLTKDVEGYGRSQDELAIQDKGRALFEAIFQNSPSGTDLERGIRTSGAPAEVQAAALAQASQSNPTLFGPPAASGHAANIEALLSGRSAPLVSLVDKTEGGGDFSTLYGNAQREGGAFAGVDVSKNTIGQLKQFSSADGAYGKHQIATLGELATPMGRFQIVGQTLAGAAKEMGLSDDVVFDDKTQVAIFEHLVDGRLKKSTTIDGKMSELRKEWVGFKEVPDATLSAAISAYEQGDKGALGAIAEQDGQEAPSPAEAMLAQASQNAASSVTGGGQTALDTITMDETLRDNEAVLGKLVDRPDRGKSKTDIIKNLLASVGEDENMTIPSLTKEVDKVLAANPGMAADVAATLVENSIKGYTSRWNNGFGKNGFFTTNGPQFVADAIRLVAPGAFDADSRFVDQDEVSRQIGEFIDPDTKQPLSKGVAQIQSFRKQQQDKASISELNGLVEQAKQEFSNAQIRAAAMGDPRILQAAQEKLEMTTAYVNQQIQAIEGGPSTRLNSSAITKQDEKKK